jgi:acetoacetate decarboxylase
VPPPSGAHRGGELRGFPNKLGSPQLTVDTDTLLDDGVVPGAIATVKSIVAAERIGCSLVGDQLSAADHFARRWRGQDLRARPLRLQQH